MFISQRIVRFSSLGNLPNSPHVLRDHRVRSFCSLAGDLFEFWRQLIFCETKFPLDLDGI